MWQWVAEAATDMAPTNATVAILRQQIPYLKDRVTEPTPASVVQYFDDSLRSMFRIANDHLADMPYFAGDEITTADIGFFPTYDSRKEQIGPLELVHLTAWGGGGDLLSIPGWTPASAKPHSQSGPLAMAGGVLEVETRVTATFPPGTPPGAWVAFDNAPDPISPDALHAGLGPPVPPALECMPGMAGDEPLGRGNRAAVAGQATAALRCYLMGTDQGDSLAAVSAGAALEEGVGAWVDLEAAIRA